MEVEVEVEVERGGMGGWRRGRLWISLSGLVVS